jgi:histidine triad (HIT) family protein
MADSIFTRIIKGELPCHKVYEDDQTFAFMDIHPVQPGQVVVVSKRQVATVWDLSDEEYQAMMHAVRTIATKMQQVFPNKKRITVMIEGLDIDHAHIKIFPADSGVEYRAEPDMDAEPDHPALAALAEKLSIEEN